MKSNRRWQLPILFAAIGVFLIVNALSRLRPLHSLGKVLPIPPEQVDDWEVRYSSNGGTSIRSLTQEQAGQILQLLEEQSYRYSGSSGSSLSSCYARLFLFASGRYRAELMLAPNAVLVRDLDTEGDSPIYTLLPDGAALQSCLLQIIHQ